MLQRLALVPLLLMTLNCNATLLQWDAFDEGDNLAVKDSVSDLVWLDLSLTAGLSFTQAKSNFTGWVIPNLEQIYNLFEAAFPIHALTPGLTYEQACITISCADQYNHWASLFGAVNYNRYSLGYYLDAGGNVSLLGASKKYNRDPNTQAIYSSYSTFGPDYSGTFDADEVSPLWSTFLIKYVEPEPEIEVITAPVVPVNMVASPLSIAAPAGINEPPLVWLMMLTLLGLLSKSYCSKTL